MFRSKYSKYEIEFLSYIRFQLQYHVKKMNNKKKTKKANYYLTTNQQLDTGPVQHSDIKHDI